MAASSGKATVQNFRPKLSFFWRGVFIITIPTLFLMISTLIIIGLRTRTIQARDQERQQGQVIAMTERALQNLVDARAKIREYGLTGDEAFLESYLTMRENISQELETIKRTIPPDSPQYGTFQNIEILIEQEMRLAEDTRATIEALAPNLGQDPQLAEQLRTSRMAIKVLRDRVDTFTIREEQLSQEREAEIIYLRNLTTKMQWIVLATSLLAAVWAIYLFYILNQELLNRENSLLEKNLHLKAHADELAYTTNILTETKEILEKRNKELNQFAYIVSHDLKAPLRAIANLSSWIEEDLESHLNENTQEQMNLLRGRVHRMEAFIEGLLAYSRIGRLKTKKATVDVQKLLAEVIVLIAPPPEFTVKVEPGMPILITEIVPLRQVFVNLISNAIKHNNQSQGIVKVFCQDLGEHYQFAVTDNGTGIDPQYHEKIFIIFQTLEARDIVENTGVGLAIVKKIIEDRGGTIRIESALGKGTKIYFTWLKLN